MDKAIARYIDAAILYPELEQSKARDAIDLVIGYGCRTVCVRPCDIGQAAARCQGTKTGICAVLGFPHGCGLSRVKGFEAKACLEAGADELDMVVNYGFIRSGEWELVVDDIKAVTEVAGPRGALVKVILETSELTTAQIVRATECAIDARADYVKTSTGFAGGGATIEAVQAMLDAARGRIKVKASGGIRDQAQARAYLDMGVSRLGAGYTSLAAICEGGPVPGQGGY